MGSLALAYSIVCSQGSSAQEFSADSRHDVPIREVVLDNGARLYSISIKVGKTEIEAALDTGSSGLRILPGTLSDNDAKVYGNARTYRFSSGVQYDGDIATGVVDVGGSIAPVTLEVIRNISCLRDKPKCPAARDTMADYGRRGNSLTGGRFRAIFGVSNARSDLVNPLSAFGVSRWIVDLPRPGEDKAGHLILNPSDGELKQFVRVPNLQVLRGTGLRDSVNGCLIETATKARICGPLMLDTGAPGLRLVANGQDKSNWRIHDTALLAFYDGSDVRAVATLALGTQEQATLLRLENFRSDEIVIFGGTSPYFAFDVLYDPVREEIGLAPRPQLPNGPLGSLPTRN